MGRVKFCEQCGADNTKRDPHARFCWTCISLRQVVNGALAAHKCVRNAIGRKEIPRADTLLCVDCGATARDYDHRDYSKPLEVEPVCSSCDKLRGPARPVLTFELPV